MIPSDIQRALDDLRAGRVGPVGTVTLDVAPATTTTVTTQAVSSGSTVVLTPYNAAAATEGIPKVVPGNGSFVITHSSSAGSRIYRYAIFTGIN